MTCVRFLPDGETVSWFPASFQRTAASPTACLWVGADHQHLQFLRLEATGREITR
jgi:hypothetical protein